MCLAVAVAAAGAGCQWPRDPEGTLDRVRGGVLRAGWTVHEPWVRNAAGRPAGVEPALVQQLAERLGARVEWTQGSESDLMSALKVRELDLAVGGFDTKAPWSQEASLTRPYLRVETVVAVPVNDPVPGDIAGQRVAVETGTEEAGLLDKTDAVPVRVPDVAEADGPVVVEEYDLGPLRLQRAGVILRQDKHVVAVPLGENGWQSEVERFLLSQDDARLLRALGAEP